MKAAVIGATGWLGNLVLEELLARGHVATAIVRDPSRVETLDRRAATAVATVTDRGALAAALDGHEWVVGAYRAPRDDPGEMPKAALAVIAAARRAGTDRIVWIGGTGVLRVPGGDTDIVDLPEFPTEWKPSTLAHREALAAFRSEAEDLAWAYVAVPRSIAPGTRTGAYRSGTNELLLDDRGESRIAAEDFAVAVVDLLETGTHRRELVTFAY